MQVKIFTLPFSPRLGGFDDAPLRQFIADKQVHGVESWHFVYEGVPYWSALVTYSLREEAPPEQAPSPSPKADRENWRKRLSDRDWPVFNALREWRKAKADKEGIPPYLVFTNEQLSRMVIDRVSSLARLGDISGVGPSRIEKYGKDVLSILHERRARESEPRAGASGADGLDGVSGVAVTDNGEIPEKSTADVVESDRQPRAGRRDDADGGAVHEDTGEAHPGG